MEALAAVLAAVTLGSLALNWLVILRYNEIKAPRPTQIAQNIIDAYQNGLSAGRKQANSALWSVNAEPIAPKMREPEYGEPAEPDAEEPESADVEVAEFLR